DAATRRRHPPAQWTGTALAGSTPGDRAGPGCRAPRRRPVPLHRSRNAGHRPAPLVGHTPPDENSTVSHHRGSVIGSSGRASIGGTRQCCSVDESDGGQVLGRPFQYVSVAAAQPLVEEGGDEGLLGLYGSCRVDASDVVGDEAAGEA